MPSPGVLESGLDAALLAMQKRIERLERRPTSSAPVLYVSAAADGPPTDGSVFWYVTDETC